jgi:hypothetical protein
MRQGFFAATLITLTNPLRMRPALLLDSVGPCAPAILFEPVPRQPFFCICRSRWSMSAAVPSGVATSRPLCGVGFRVGLTIGEESALGDIDGVGRCAPFVAEAMAPREAPAA